MENQSQSSKLTFVSFSLETFKDEKLRMENFRNNCYRSNMTEIWKSLKDTYLPDTSKLQVFAQYSFDADGNSTPDRLFARGQDDEIFDFHEPIVAIKVHTALSILTQRVPDVKWDSDSSMYDDRTPVLNALRKNDWMDDQTRQQYVMLWFYKILFGTTYWRRFYEKSEREVFLPSKIDLANDKVDYEKQMLVDYDQVTAEALSPLQVWIDPSTKPFQARSMRKVKYDKVYDYQDFLRLFGDKVDQKVLDEIHPSSMSEGEKTGDNLVKCEFYENMDLDLLYVVAQDKELFKTHLPDNHKQLSVLMAIWMPRGDENPFGLGPIEMMSEDADALNQFKSMTFTQTKFSIYKALFHSGSLVGEGGQAGDIKIRPDQVYKATNPREIAFFDMPGPGKDAWDAQNNLRARIDDSSGINRPLGGEIVNTTAFQTDLAKDAALARLSVPINSMVALLRRDAYLMFELQKQYYSLPEVTELMDPDEMARAMQELEEMKAQGNANFSLFVDEAEEGTRMYRGDFRSVQLNVDQLPSGQQLPTEGKQEVMLSPEVFDWKGKIYVVADSLLTITPTIDRQKKLELFNLLLPLFGQPPQLVAKAAKELVKLYGEDYQDYFPESWIQYLASIENGTMPNPLTPGPEAPMMPPQQDSGGSLSFEQQRAPQVATNIGGQKDLISAQSQQINM